nr:hypothetical protein [Natrialba sp. INN-245]
MSGGFIDIDEFENGDDDAFKERNNTERIESFLDENDDRAWKAAVIAKRLKLDTDAASAILSRLKERSLCGTSIHTGRLQTTRSASKLPTGYTSITRLQTSSTEWNVLKSSRPTRWRTCSDRS